VFLIRNVASETLIISKRSLTIRCIRKVAANRVGSKGELFPPKKIRERLGLRPNTAVVYKIEEGRLLVEPVPSLEDVLKDSPTVEVTLEEFHRFRKELSKKAES